MRAAVGPPTAPARRLAPVWVGVTAVGVAAGAVVLVLVIYPTWKLVAGSFLSAGRLTLAHYVHVGRDPDAYRVLANSLIVAVGAAVCSTALGTGFAWLVARTDLPWRHAWHTLLLLPYMIPPFVGAIAWVYLLSPVGYLNQLWIALTSASTPLVIIYGPIGIIFVLTLYGYPIAYLAMLGVLERMNPVLEEAARMARATPARVLWDITLPLMLPGLLSGGLLVFLSSLANFGIPAVLGFPVRYFVLPTKIYSTILNFDLRENLQVAAALSMWLVVIAGIVLALHQRVVQRGQFVVVTGQAAAVTRVALGKWRWPLAASLAGFAVTSVALPLGAIVLTSITRAYGLAPTPANLTLQHYATILGGVPKVHRALLNSLGLAAGAATVITLLALGIGYLIGRVHIRGARVLELIITVPYAVPGTVVALAMILAWLRPLPLLHVRLYDTLGIILLAYIARFLVFGVRTVLAGLSQVHASLEEAARMSGASALEAFKDIVVPILRPSLVAGWFLVFIPAIAELTLSILLFSVGNETLGVVIFGLHEEGKIALSAALAFLVTLCLVGLHLATRVVLRRELVS